MQSGISRLFPPISQEAVSRLSQSLAEASNAVSPAASKCTQDFHSRKDGVFYRSVEDMRAECSRLKFTSKVGASSASVITAGPAHQSVYQPNWMPTVGFLVNPEANVTAISKGLFLETPRGQSAQDITAIREEIVARLKSGDTSTPFQPTHFYSPRQTGVNEAHIEYSADDVAAYVLPIRQAEALNENIIGNKTSSPQASRARAEHLKMIAQLGYAVSRLGIKPIYAFGEGKLTPVKLTANDWNSLLSKLNEAAEDEYLLQVAGNPTDGDQPKALSLAAAADQLNALDKTIDPHEIKHIGGPLTRIPVDIFTALFSKK